MGPARRASHPSLDFPLHDAREQLRMATRNMQLAVQQARANLDGAMKNLAEARQIASRGAR